MEDDACCWLSADGVCVPVRMDGDAVCGKTKEHDYQDIILGYVYTTTNM